MVWKLENPSIIIDGRSILKTIIWTHVLIHIHKTICIAERVHYEKLEDELKAMKKEQKISKKKQKVESK